MEPTGGGGELGEWPFEVVQTRTSPTKTLGFHMDGRAKEYKQDSSRNMRNQRLPILVKWWLISPPHSIIIRFLAKKRGIS